MPDQMLIEKGKVVLTTEEGQRVERPERQLVDMLRGEFVPPLSDCALPDGVKFWEWRAPLFLVVHQQPPHVRQLRWIAPDSPEMHGEGVKYRPVRLSLPYAITFAVYSLNQGRLYLTGANELYFRNAPIHSRADKLCFPALLNISRIGTTRRPRAWVCTQYLRYNPKVDWSEQLQALLEHVWNGGFNLSSEVHEGKSWFTASRGVHRDLQTVEAWEKASEANDAFALGVKWKAAPLSIGELMDAMLEEQGQPPAFLEKKRARKKDPGLVARFMNHVLKK